MLGAAGYGQHLSLHFVESPRGQRMEGDDVHGETIDHRIVEPKIAFKVSAEHLQGRSDIGRESQETLEDKFKASAGRGSTCSSTL